MSALGYDVTNHERQTMNYNHAIAALEAERSAVIKRDGGQTAANRDELRAINLRIISLRNQRDAQL